MFAPSRTSSAAVSAWPFQAASRSAVQPVWCSQDHHIRACRRRARARACGNTSFAALGSAPRRTSSVTVSVWPRPAALSRTALSYCTRDASGCHPATPSQRAVRREWHAAAALAMRARGGGELSHSRGRGCQRPPWPQRDGRPLLSRPRSRPPTATRASSLAPHRSRSLVSGTQQGGDAETRPGNLLVQRRRHRWFSRQLDRPPCRYGHALMIWGLLLCAQTQRPYQLHFRQVSAS
jgi:hypothetical protein